MNSIPHIYQMLEEVCERIGRYERPRAFAQSLMFSQLHAGRINRRLVEGPNRVSREKLGALSTATLLRNIDETLGSMLVNLVGGSTDQYAAISRLHELVKNPEAD
jgi:hypothetical protein